MANFTPGPWRKFGLPKGRGLFSIWGPPSAGHVANITKSRLTATKHCRPMTIDEGNANANLIAAAPDLYEGLKDARSFLEIALRTSVVHDSTGKGGHDGDGNSWSECAGIPEWRARQMLDEWNTALAKADGKVDDNG